MGFKKTSLQTNDSLHVWEKWKANSCQPNFWQVGTVIRTPLLPNTSVLIREVSFREREQHIHFTVLDAKKLCPFKKGNTVSSVENIFLERDYCMLPEENYYFLNIF